MLQKYNTTVKYISNFESLVLVYCSLINYFTILQGTAQQWKKKIWLSSKTTSSMKSIERLETHITVNVHWTYVQYSVCWKILFQNLIWLDLGLSPKNPVIQLGYQSWGDSHIDKPVLKQKVCVTSFVGALHKNGISPVSHEFIGGGKSYIILFWNIVWKLNFGHKI
jgi:hypothetical protein